MEEAGEPQVHHDVFKVTCGAMSGALHKRRFASGKGKKTSCTLLNKLLIQIGHSCLAGVPNS